MEFGSESVKTLGGEMRFLHGRARNDGLRRATHDELLDDQGPGRCHRLGDYLAGRCPGASWLSQRGWSGGAAPDGRAAPLHVALVRVRQNGHLRDLDRLGDPCVVQRGDQSVLSTLSATGVHRVGRTTGRCDKGLDQLILVQLRVRRGRPPDAGLAQVVEGLEPVAGWLRTPLAQWGLVHAGKADRYGLQARSDVEDRLIGQPERGQARLQFLDRWLLAVQAQIRRAGEPFADRVRVDGNLGLRRGQLNYEDAWASADHRPTPQDWALDLEAICQQQVAAAEERGGG